MMLFSIGKFRWSLGVRKKPLVLESHYIILSSDIDRAVVADTFRSPVVFSSSLRATT